MEYQQLRKEILQYLRSLQGYGYSYQSICDFINDKETGFVLYKDFFSRFQSKKNYYATTAKKKKLELIHHYMDVFYQQNVSEEDNLIEWLKKVISSAVTQKFEAYLEINHLPQFAESSLADFYLKNSPALLRIEKSLKHKKQYNWQLDVLNYGSSFEILSMQSSNLFNNHAVIETTEFWKLCWIEKKSKKLQFNHESLGKHIYLLSKDQSGRWKINEDLIEYHVQKVEPAYIDYFNLQQLASISEKENKATADNFISEDDLLNCIAFIKTIYTEDLSTNYLIILDRIRESCLNFYRLLNTDVISFNVFQSEIRLLKRQLQLLIDGIFLKIK